MILESLNMVNENTEEFCITCDVPDYCNQCDIPDYCVYYDN